MTEIIAECSERELAASVADTAQSRGVSAGVGVTSEPPTGTLIRSSDRPLLLTLSLRQRTF